MKQPRTWLPEEETSMPCVLVVATAELRHRLIAVLRHAGYSVAEADSADSALNIVRSASPKLILMSIVMPDGNGLEVAARLRRSTNGEPLAPIILLGSVPPIGINEEPLASLVSGYLPVGVSPDDLLVAVRSHLGTDSQSEKSS